jgi:hypothetical protein
LAAASTSSKTCSAATGPWAGMPAGAAIAENRMPNSNIIPKPVTIHLLNMSNTSTMMPKAAAARDAFGRHSTWEPVFFIHATPFYDCTLTTVSTQEQANGY